MGNLCSGEASHGTTAARGGGGTQVRYSKEGSQSGSEGMEYLDDDGAVSQGRATAEPGTFKQYARMQAKVLTAKMKHGIDGSAELPAESPRGPAVSQPDIIEAPILPIGPNLELWISQRQARDSINWWIQYSVSECVRSALEEFEEADGAELVDSPSQRIAHSIALRVSWYHCEQQKQQEDDGSSGNEGDKRSAAATAAAKSSLASKFCRPTSSALDKKIFPAKNGILSLFNTCGRTGLSRSNSLTSHTSQHSGRQTQLPESPNHTPSGHTKGLSTPTTGTFSIGMSISSADGSLSHQQQLPMPLCQPPFPDEANNEEDVGAGNADSGGQLEVGGKSGVLPPTPIVSSCDLACKETVKHAALLERTMVAPLRGGAIAANSPATAAGGSFGLALFRASILDEWNVVSVNTWRNFYAPIVKTTPVSTWRTTAAAAATKTTAAAIDTALAHNVNPIIFREVRCEVELNNVYGSTNIELVPIHLRVDDPQGTATYFHKLVVASATADGRRRRREKEEKEVHHQEEEEEIKGSHSWIPPRDPLRLFLLPPLCWEEK